ncbi:MAG TPA: hypothetical protein VG826_27470 [Pirellulales bacterium]|nr:hypothetical protein [Pirellulales bacterium]
MEKPPFQVGLKAIFGLTTLVVLLLTGWLAWIVDAALLLVAVIGYGVLFFLLGLWVSRGIDLIAVTILTVWLGWNVERARRRERAMDRL